MTLDKTLQKIIQRAELAFKIKTKEHAEWLANNTKNGVMPQYFCGVEQENCRLKDVMIPIIQGLCEEVQRLTSSLKFFSEGIVVGNIPHIGPVTISGTKAKADLAISTSALEKLGGGDE